METKIENIGAAWPWPKVSDSYKAGKVTWFESNEERWDYGLGVLPPIYFDGGFFVSEPSDHDRRGMPVYAAWIKRGNRFFVREVVKDKIKEAIEELNLALSQEEV